MTCANFQGTHYLSHAAAPFALGAGKSFTVAGWAWFDDDDDSDAKCIIAQWNTGPQNAFIFRREDTTHKLRLDVSQSGGAGTWMLSTLAPIASNWHFLAAGLDLAQNQLWIRHNAARVYQYHAQYVAAVTAPLSLGMYNVENLQSAPLFGRLANWGFWQHAVPATKLDDFQKYGIWPPNAVARWQLNESSGGDAASPRADIAGLYNLADPTNVPSVNDSPDNVRHHASGPALALGGL